MRPAITLLLAAGALTALVVVGLVVVDPSADEPEPPPRKKESFSTTPLAGFVTTTLTVGRRSFCADVDPREVEAALGAEPVDATGYDNGEQVELTPDVTDVAHEYGCTWVTDDRSTARAWVFAPPVDADRARRLVRETARTKGCESSTTPAYGSPSVGLVCLGEGGSVASYRGLFGDAWLTCELDLTSGDGAAPEVQERAGAWCVAVARAASGG